MNFNSTNFTNFNFSNFSNLLRTNESNQSNESNGNGIPTLIYYTTSQHLYPEDYGYNNNGNFFNDELDNLTYNVQFRNDFRNIVGNYINSVNNLNTNASNVSNASNLQFEFSEAFIPASSFIERIFADYIQNKNKLNEEEYSNTTIKLHDKLDECPICFNSSDISIKIKKCNHMFCENCIHKWLREHKNTCPICRTNVLKRTNSEIDNFENENDNENDNENENENSINNLD